MLWMKKRRTAVFLLLFEIACLDFIFGRFLTYREDKRFKDIENYWNNESQIRTSSSVYHHDLKPNNSQIILWGHPYRLTTNSLGFRDFSTRIVPLRSPKHRIVFIGDSFTEGMGIDYKDAFVGRIQNILASQEIEVLDAAVESYSPIIYFRKIQYLIEKKGLKFDELVVYIDLSDAQDEAEFYKMSDDGRVIDRNPDNGPEEPLAPVYRSFSHRVKSFFVQNSMLCRGISTIHQSFKNPPGWYFMEDRASWTVDSAFFERFGRAGLESEAYYMDKLSELLERNHISLTIAVYPWPTQIYYHDLDSKQVIFWKQWAVQHRAGFIDYFPYFIRDKNWKKTLEEYFNFGDVHWNAKGHALVAEVFLKTKTFTTAELPSSPKR